jgi:hypothetical protein
MDAQFEYMLVTAQSWAIRLKVGKLPRHLTWKAWMSTITKTLEYPLPVTTLTRAQCQKLSSVLIRAALPQVGVVNTFPRALAHAPRKFFGLKIPDFYIQQGVAHVDGLVKLSKSTKHPTARLLRHSAEAMRIQMGCNGPLFQVPWQCYNLLDHSWLKSTWEFVHNFGLRIDDDDIPDLQPWRECDVLLIPTFLRLGYVGQELRWLNMCRLYLKVSWLSEICSGDGIRIIRRFFEHSAIPVTSDVRYPIQGDPPKGAWIIWKRALQRLCNNNQVLHQPLGHWVRSPAWLYDPVSERLFHQAETTREYQQVRTRRSRNSWATFSNPVDAGEIPKSALPATVIPGQNPMMTGFSELLQTDGMHRADTFLSFLSGINAEARWVVQNVEIVGDWESWASASEHRLQGVSDGISTSRELLAG